MESETEKYFRRRNRDKKWGQIIALMIMLPIILLVASCFGFLAR